MISIRNYGVVLLELTDLNSMVLRNFMKTNGSEGLIISVDSNFAFIKDGINGVTILDIKNLPILKIAS